jgi:hypothetical protein
MTPINNNQMSEQDNIPMEMLLNNFAREFGDFIASQLPDNSQKSFAVLHAHMTVWLGKELSTLISHERAEAVMEFVKWLPSDLDAPDEGYYAPEVYKRAVEYLAEQYLKKGTE